MIPSRLHLIGIGGAGMAALAHYLIGTGRSVSGSDTRDSPACQRLQAAGASITYGHQAASVDGSELVVVSDAIATDNVEIEAARSRRIPLLRRAECLDALAQPQRSLMVAGSHGKSTTAAMIACVLDAAGLDPSFILGADIRCLGNTQARAGAGAFAVIEACEAFQNLDCFNPDIAIITNIDDEHVNHYASQTKLDAAFADFANRAGTRIVSGEDPGIARIRAALGPVTSFGLHADCDISAAPEPAAFSVRIRGSEAGAVRLPLPGDHMRRNALAAVAAGLAIDLPFQTIARGLAQFTGVARRWEEIGVAAGVRIVDDYAHHPAEILASLRTARAAAPGARLIAVFQPLLGSRLQRLHAAFAESLSNADAVLLLDLDSGGELGAAAGSWLIAEGLQRLGTAVQLRGNTGDLIEYAPADLKAGDFVLVMGGRGMEDVAQRLHARLSGRAARPAGASRRSWITRVSGRLRPPASIVDLFRRAVRADPASPALHHPGGAVSYAWLDAASDTVAGNLAANGLKGRVIGVRLPQSLDLVVAMLGILKAGATYLPLDTALPAARIAFMLERAGAAACITRDAQTGCPNLRFDALNSGKHPVPPGPGKTAPAYICFTSGSTGQPKGITVSHASLFALLGDAVHRFGIGPGSRMALNTSIGFDVSLFELCATLAAGAALVIGATRPMVGDRLGEFLARAEVTHLCVTPTVLASMKPRSLPALQVIIAAGEACPSALMRAWAPPGRRFFNVYGPTEATIYATADLCRPEQEVTIGTALGHLAAHVLDAARCPLPDGEIGELWLSGIGLAEGYIGQPEETAQRFPRTPQGRFYRTGDMVRRAPSGALSFVGRADDQIKLLGNRLELAEIEQTARRQEGIADAAAGVLSGERKALVCFVLPAPGFRFDAAAFREQLAAWLPPSAIPAHIVPIAGMPMTPSGKKDRRRLLAEHATRIITWADEFLPPNTALETRLAELWRDLLQLDRDVGMIDRFAQLGGDSLAGLQLVIAIETEFQVTIPPGYLGRLTTIPKMAVALAELFWDRDNGPLPQGSGFKDTRIFRQLFAICANWPGERRHPDSLISSLGAAMADRDLFLCCQIEREFSDLARWLPASYRTHAMRSGHLVIDQGPGGLRQLTAHYVAEIEQINPRGVLVIAGVCQGGVIAQMVAEALSKRGRNIALLVLIEPTQPRFYPGKVALICGDGSFRNPRRQDGGEAPFRTAFPAGYTIDLVESSHGHECVEPAVRALAQHVVRRLAGVMAPTPGAI